MIGWRLLDVFFIASHISIMLFILFGWLFARMRKVHLAVMVLTLFSWIVLGFRYGFGYCFWTDWHWMVRAKLGNSNMPGSFVKFIVDALTGIDHNPTIIDWITAASFAFCFAVSIISNFKPAH